MSSLIQITGYLASVLLGISLLINNDLKFRWLNTSGCAAFIVYGILITAFPVILTNTVLLLINGYSLFKIYRKTEAFELLEFEAGAPLVTTFLQFYRADVAAYFPRFTQSTNQRAIRFMVLRDMAIANVFVATLTNEGTAHVQLNYTVSKYRDYKVGRFIFEKEKAYLQAKGIKKLVYAEVANKSHSQFLKTMGFQRVATGWEKGLN